jgi:hypothetical protein
MALMLWWYLVGVSPADAMLLIVYLAGLVRAVWIKVVGAAPVGGNLVHAQVHADALCSCHQMSQRFGLQNTAADAA